MSFAQHLIYSKFGKDINKIIKKHPDIKEELEKLILDVYKYGYDKGYNDTHRSIGHILRLITR